MDDPAMIMRAFGPISMIAPSLLWLVVAGPMLIYPIARWRAHREPVADQQLGLKVVLGYFGMLAFQLALIGATVVVYAMVSRSPSDDRGDIARAGFGFLIPGLVILATHAAFLRRTNDAQFPAVRRLCLGYSLLITGLCGLTSFVLACQALFAKSSSGDFGRFCGAAFVIYVSAWVVCGVRFGRLALGSYASGEPPDVVPPPSGGEPPSTPSLPSLGGGAFPPIDPKG